MELKRQKRMQQWNTKKRKVLEGVESEGLDKFDQSVSDSEESLFFLMMGLL